MEMPILSIKKLSVEINKREILNNLSLTITNKSIICIIAPNGSGKTTPFKTINNQIASKSGEIILNPIFVASLIKTFISGSFLRVFLIVFY